jgi:hypothetical protein
MQMYQGEPNLPQSHFRHHRLLPYSIDMKDAYSSAPDVIIPQTDPLILTSSCVSPTSNLKWIHQHVLTTATLLWLIQQTKKLNRKPYSPRSTITRSHQPEQSIHPLQNSDVQQTPPPLTETNSIHFHRRQYRSSALSSMSSMKPVSCSGGDQQLRQRGPNKTSAGSTKSSSTSNNNTSNQSSSSKRTINSKKSDGTAKDDEDDPEEFQANQLLQATRDTSKDLFPLLIILVMILIALTLAIVSKSLLVTPDGRRRPGGPQGIVLEFLEMIGVLDGNALRRGQPLGFYARDFRDMPRGGGAGGGGAAAGGR